MCIRDRFNEDTDRADKCLALAKKYTDFSELTAPMINEFVEKIVVHAPDRSTCLLYTSRCV